jgi:hypothetical protein
MESLEPEREMQGTTIPSIAKATSNNTGNNSINLDETLGRHTQEDEPAKHCSNP